MNGMDRNTYEPVDTGLSFTSKPGYKPKAQRNEHDWGHKQSFFCLGTQSFFCVMSIARLRLGIVRLTDRELSAAQKSAVTISTKKMNKGDLYLDIDMAGMCRSMVSQMCWYLLVYPAAQYYQSSHVFALKTARLMHECLFDLNTSTGEGARDFEE